MMADFDDFSGSANGSRSGCAVHRGEMTANAFSVAVAGLTSESVVVLHGVVSPSFWPADLLSGVRRLEDDVETDSVRGRAPDLGIKIELRSRTAIDTLLRLDVAVPETGGGLVVAACIFNKCWSESWRSRSLSWRCNLAILRVDMSGRIGAADDGGGGSDDGGGGNEEGGGGTDKGTDTP